MKGFKPTGYGPSVGFKFPASFGFTGSTGAYTNVSPYVRQKPRAFKDGGYVSEKVPDPGHATVKRDRPYTNEDQESGGRTPLRPGYKNGGKLAKMPKKMRKADGGSVGIGAFSTLARMRKRPSPKPPVATIAKEKFAADGGRIVRGSSAKPFGESMGDIIPLGVSAGRNVIDSIKRAMSSGRRAVGEQGRSVMEEANTAVSGKTTASNYSRGGKAMACRYAKGGMAGSAKAQDRKMIGTALKKHVNTPAPKGHKGLGAMCK